MIPVKSFQEICNKFPIASQNLHHNKLLTIYIDQGCSYRIISVLFEFASKLAVSKNNKK